MAVTISEVAREAGVSIKTVSRVVNREPNVAVKTRERVQGAIEKLGYRPNALARGLASGRSGMLAVLIPQISDPFYADFVQGAEAVARDKGFRLLLCHTSLDPRRELDSVSDLAAARVDGFILCGTRLTPEQIGVVAEAHPVVAVTGHRPEGVSVLRIRGEDGTRATTNHQLELGHTRIAYVGPQRDGPDYRRLGYEDAMGAATIKIDSELIRSESTQSIEDGRRAAEYLISARPDLTAVCCYNDLMAVGVMQACEAAGLSVPDDVSVAGFGDVPLSRLITPRLTTIHVPRYEMGEDAIKMLFEKLEDPEAYEHRDVDVDLQIRASTGAHYKTKGK